MKRVFAFSLFVCAFFFLAAPAAKADPSYLYFDVEAFDWGGWKYFDFARIGVADDDDVIGYLNVVVSDGQGGLTTSAFAESDADRSSAIGWADISEYVGNADVWFFAQAYDDENEEFVWDYDAESGSKMTYADLVKGNHIATSTTNPEYVTPWVVPEPTSALLLLLGLGALALRRKAGAHVPGDRNRRLASPALCLLLCLPFLGFAAADDTLISFSTKGPDRYLDGTTVKDGECYALIWTKTGETFGGLAADGSAIGSNSQVVVFAPVAKGGRCPPVLFEIDAELAKGFAGGAFGVYLLDTRLASGNIGGVNAQGVPVAVNGWGSVDTTSLAQRNGDSNSVPTDQAAASAGASIAVTTRSSLPENTPQPVITAIRIVGDNVFLTVRNTLPCLQYAAHEVEKLGEGDAAADSAPVQGAAASDAEITIIAPKRGDSGFFSVGRR